MKTVYLDSNFKCHTSDDGTMMAIETDFFDGKCDVFIEGYRFVPNGESWKREDGKVFSGKMISPWKSSDELETAQREYERQLIEQQAAELAELDALVLELQYNTLMEDL